MTAEAAQATVEAAKPAAEVALTTTEAAKAQAEMAIAAAESAKVQAETAAARANSAEAQAAMDKLQAGHNIRSVKQAQDHSCGGSGGSRVW